MRSRLVPLALLLAAGVGLCQDKPKADPPKTEPGKFAGPTTDGFLLPNGWHLTPVGKHAVTTDLPLNVIPLKDNKHALVATSGWNTHDLYLIDISGAQRELLEGATALFASVVLLWVGVWMHDRRHAAAWQDYI